MPHQFSQQYFWIDSGWHIEDHPHIFSCSDTSFFLVFRFPLSYATFQLKSTIGVKFPRKVLP